MKEYITIENQEDWDIHVFWNETDYVLRAHAKIEIPGNIISKFTEKGRITRISNRFDDGNETEKVLHKPAGATQAPPVEPINSFKGITAKSDDSNLDISKNQYAKMPDVGVDKVDGKIARAMAKEDAAAFNLNNKPKRAKTAKKGVRGRPRKNKTK